MAVMIRLLLTVAVWLQTVSGQDYNLVWSDEFDGPILNPNNWQHEVTAWGGGNSEFQVYTDDPENTYVKNGLLHIKPTLLVNNTNPSTGQPYGEDFLYNGHMDLVELYGRCSVPDNNGCVRDGPDIPPAMSGRIRTFERFSFQYGRVEVRAKMPKADWTWPAIWLLPEYWVYGDWPRSGEIDIVESIGNEDFTLDGSWAGIQKMGSTLHWGQSWDQNRYYLTNSDAENAANDFANNFHVYAMDWDENGLRFYLDGFSLLTVPDPTIENNPSWTGFWDYGAPWNNMGDRLWDSGTELAPFDQSFHFMMNVAVGGTNYYIPDGGVNRGGAPYNKPWTNGISQYAGCQAFWNARNNWYWTWEKEGDDAAMQVDYIRVYQKA